MKNELKEINEWKKIRSILNNNYNYTQDSAWNDAIRLFRKRLQIKYFDPIDLIIKNGPQNGEGFTIVTVQCTLIEALASFETGEVFKYDKTNKDENFYYSNSKKVYVKFLKQASIFDGIFHGAGAKFDAEKFYKEVRCGLVHGAHTKENWIINTTNKRNVKFLELKDDKISIYRTILQKELKEYLIEYSNKLTIVSNTKLRRLFARKLDHLFGIKPDKYEWWNK